MKFTNIQKLRTLVAQDDAGITSVSAHVLSVTDTHAIVELAIMSDCQFKLTVEPAEELSSLKPGTYLEFTLADGEISNITAPKAEAQEKPKKATRSTGSGCHTPLNMPKFSDL